MMFRGKRGIAPIVVAGAVLFMVALIYLGLFIPIPAFKSLRQTINYFLVVILWILFQFAIIYGAYRVIAYLGLAYKTYRYKILGWALNVKKFIVSH
jgi:hypothetical protein